MEGIRERERRKRKRKGFVKKIKIKNILKRLADTNLAN